MVFISGGVVYVVYGGIGLGYYFVFNFFWGVFVFFLVMVLAMGWVVRKY